MVYFELDSGVRDIPNVVESLNACRQMSIETGKDAAKFLTNCVSFSSVIQGSVDYFFTVLVKFSFLITGLVIFYKFGGKPAELVAIKIYKENERFFIYISYLSLLYLIYLIINIAINFLFIAYY